ncbi:MAG: hypothetical protein ACRDNT_09790, partial [Streptosporangiaceae bacterium]
MDRAVPVAAPAGGEPAVIEDGSALGVVAGAALSVVTARGLGPAFASGVSTCCPPGRSSADLAASDASVGADPSPGVATPALRPA